MKINVHDTLDRSFHISVVSRRGARCHNRTMLELGVKTLTAYLLGALLGSLVLGRLRGVDIRSLGSGNAGATNALRTQGKLFALSVFVIDVGKGVLAVTYLPRAALPGWPWLKDPAPDSAAGYGPLPGCPGRPQPGWNQPPACDEGPGWSAGTWPTAGG